MIKLDKMSQFNICSSFTLSSDDLYSLTLLYEPLIGSEALSIYLLFNSLLERSNLISQTITHIDLFDLMNLDEKKFYDSRLKLEAINLITTYYDNKNYTYLLKTPLTPKQFLADGTLGLYLYGKIGKKMFEFLLNKFKIAKINKKDYQDITVSFDEVFSSHIPEYKLDKGDNYLLGRKPNQTISIRNQDFNFEEFLSSIDSGFLEYGVTENFQKAIINVSYTYNFDEGDMEYLYRESINKMGFFDYKILKKQAAAFYQFKYSQERPKLETKGFSEENEIITSMSRISGALLLDKYAPNYTPADLELVNKLYDEIKLPHVVINFMLFSLLNEMGGQVLPFSYYKKTADTWISKGTITAKKAHDYVMKLEKPQISKKPAGYVDKNKEKSSEQWVKDYIKNIKEGLETL